MLTTIKANATGMLAEFVGIVKLQIELKNTLLFFPNQKLTRLASSLCKREIPVVVVNDAPCVMCNSRGIFVPKKDLNLPERVLEAIIHHECYHIISENWRGMKAEVAADAFAAAAGYGPELAHYLAKAVANGYPMLRKLLSTRLAKLQATS